MSYFDTDAVHTIAQTVGGTTDTTTFTLDPDGRRLTSTDVNGSTTTTGAQTGVNDYGWEGGAQRAATSTGLTLMGARVYNTYTGRFTSPDPVVGGNENAYNYADDSVNGRGANGQKKTKRRTTIRAIGPGM